MIVGSLCSGISADSAAWRPLGWRHAWFAEIDKFCCAVLRHHHPETPNYGDFTRHSDFAPIDLLMVSTPCQDFSVAGRREGMGGARGSLTMAALEVLERTRPRWLVFENVPGLLQSDCSLGFREFLSRLAKLGYGFAYRVSDAQYAGLAQRRERVFLVGYLGDWRPAAAVFLDQYSLQGHPAPSRETRERVAPTLSARTKGGGGLGTDFDLDGGLISSTLLAQGNTTGGHRPPGTTADTAASLIPVYPILEAGARTGKSTDDPRAGIGIGGPEDPMYTLQSAKQHAVAFSCKDHGADVGEIAPTLRAMGHQGSHANAGGQVAVAHALGTRNSKGTDERGDGSSNLQPVGGMAVRRLTPRECEALQGFPPDYTLIPEYRKKQKETGAAAEALYAYLCRTERGLAFTEMKDGRVWCTPDGPRYKALGNSIAVTELRWIGERIQMVENILRERAA